MGIMEETTVVAQIKRKDLESGTMCNIYCWWESQPSTTSLGLGVVGEGVGHKWGRESVSVCIQWFSNFAVCASIPWRGGTSRDACHPPHQSL